MSFRCVSRWLLSSRRRCLHFDYSHCHIWNSRAHFQNFVSNWFVCDEQHRSGCEISASIILSFPELLFYSNEHLALIEACNALKFWCEYKKISAPTWDRSTTVVGKWRTTWYYGRTCHSRVQWSDSSRTTPINANVDFSKYACRAIAIMWGRLHSIAKNPARNRLSSAVRFLNKNIFCARNAQREVTPRSKWRAQANRARKVHHCWQTSAAQRHHGHVEPDRTLLTISWSLIFRIWSHL